MTASAKGASHTASGAPNQDAVATERAGPAGVVAAVADGHGHSRHLRSGRGSRIAVRVGCQVAQELADRIESEGLLTGPDDAEQTAGQLQSLVEEFCVPAVIERWQDAVLADVAADPFTEAEQAHRHAGDDPVIAYGSTLLLGHGPGRLAAAGPDRRRRRRRRAGGRRLHTAGPGRPPAGRPGYDQPVRQRPAPGLPYRGRQHPAQNRCSPSCSRPTATATPRSSRTGRPRSAPTWPGCCTTGT